MPDQGSSSVSFPFSGLGCPRNLKNKVDLIPATPTPSHEQVGTLTAGSGCLVSKLNSVQVTGLQVTVGTSLFPLDPLGDKPTAHGYVVSAMRTEAGCLEFQYTGLLTSTALFCLSPGRGAGGAVEFRWGCSSLPLLPPQPRERAQKPPSSLLTVNLIV